MRVTIGNEKVGYQFVYYAISVEDKTIVSTNFTNKAVNPYHYTLPTELQVVYADGTTDILPVTFVRRSANGFVEFTDEDIAYAGGKFDIFARFITSDGGCQDVSYTLIVNQKLLKSIAIKNLTIDQFVSEIDLSFYNKEGVEITAYFFDGTSENFTLPYAKWLVEKVGLEGYQIVAEEEGNWNFDNVSVDLKGGSFYASLKLGNDIGGYQYVDIPVIVKSKVLDTDNVRYVVERTDAYVKTAPLSEILVGANEYFTLPNNLWLTYTDGSVLNVEVEWDLDGVDGSTYGSYNAYATVFGDTVTVKVTVTPERVVVGDNLPSYYSVRRGSSINYPTSIKQTVIINKNGQEIEDTTVGTYAIVWDSLPTVTIEDDYLVTGTVLGGGITWKKTIGVYVYSNYVTNVVAINDTADDSTVSNVENDATKGQVPQGTTLDPSMLPTLKVNVMLGATTGVRNEVSVNWKLVGIYDAEGEYTAITADVNDFSLIDTKQIAHRYLLQAVIYDRFGARATYENGGDVLFELRIVEPSPEKEITVYKDSVANPVRDFVYTYGDKDITHVNVYVTKGIMLEKIEYYDLAGNVVGRAVYDLGEIVEGEYSYPQNAGEYTVKIFVDAYGTEYVLGNEDSNRITFTIHKKCISDSIIVVDTDHRYNGDSKSAVANTVDDIASVHLKYFTEDANGTFVSQIAYRLCEEGDYAKVDGEYVIYNENIHGDALRYQSYVHFVEDATAENVTRYVQVTNPTEVGTYQVYAYVDTANYVGSKIVTMKIVNEITVKFFTGIELVIDDFKTGDGGMLSSDRIGKMSLSGGEGNFEGWYYYAEDDNGDFVYEQTENIFIAYNASLHQGVQRYSKQSFAPAQTITTEMCVERVVLDKQYYVFNIYAEWILA